jgi:hypothetical protein
MAYKIIRNGKPVINEATKVVKTFPTLVEAEQYAKLSDFRVYQLQEIKTDERND